MPSLKEIHELLGIELPSELCFKEQQEIPLDVILYEYINEDLMEMS